VARGEVVEWLNRGYGFIRCDDPSLVPDGKDLFFHSKDVSGAGVKQAGARVAFEIADSPKGLQAVKVRSEQAPEPVQHQHGRAEDEVDVLTEAEFLTGLGPAIDAFLAMARKHGWVE